MSAPKTTPDEVKEKPPRVRFTPTKCWLINPHPDSGAPGLEVCTDRRGRLGLRIKDVEDSGFVLSRDAAVQLGQIIEQEIAGPAIELSVWTGDEKGWFALACDWREAAPEPGP